MSHQLIEVILPEGKAEAVSELLHDTPLTDTWHAKLEVNRAGIYLLQEEVPL